MTLEDLRTRIDAIDDDILGLLERRADLATEVLNAKRATHAITYDPERERRVLDRLEARGAGRFPRQAIRAVYREVMGACLALQEQVRVAFLGPAGTFSHAAAREMFGLSARYVEAATIDGVFDAVRRGVAPYGVVPIENSTEGAVTDATDALIEGDIKVRREMVMAVDQCLLSNAAGLTDVRRVYSHPQALAQCRQWLATSLSSAQLVETPSTGAAVREALADAGGAAIGGLLAAEVHGLPILRQRVQDRPDNATRFLLIGRDDAPRSGDDRTTIVFAVHDAPGALRRVLEVFDGNGVNLSRIESRPSRQRAWDYVFIVDVEGHRDDAGLRASLETLSTICPMMRCAGSYPRHRT